MKELIDYFLKFGSLNQQQIELISSKAIELNLRRDEYYLEAGKIARQFGFILDGIARVCYYNNKGEEITKYFIEENNILVNLDSFDNEITSKALLKKIERISPLVAEDATTRYLKFIEIYPSLANRIPLSYIASYLGITQSSLSRIRKNIR
jgi:CRP-like cAMP-binding protein